jgi:threonine dehydratase
VSEHKLLNLEAIVAASKRIQSHVIRTPVLERTVGGCTLLIKPEGLQATGAFKLRGAINKMAGLPQPCPGVVAHSSGNHAQAVARAAKILGLHAVIVMPDDAPPIKRAKTEADGATVVVVGPDSDERRDRAAAISKDQGLVLVEPYDDLEIAAGQGTVALELIEDAGDIDMLLVPVSGGGLMAGCAVATRALCPTARIIAVEPAQKDALSQSLAAGKRVAVPPPKTIADGLRVRRVGAHTWPILQSHVDRVVMVDDPALEEAMAWALMELRIVLEPSGAAALAAALDIARSGGKGRLGVVCTGGNVEPKLLARIATGINSGRFLSPAKACSE